MMTLWLQTQLWLGDTVPRLPSLTALSLARHLGWALVLACIAWRGWFGLRWLPGRWRALLACGFAVAALVPSPAGLTYWLGLAFQVPSVTTMGLALWCLLPQDQHSLSAPSHRGVFSASLAAVVLGWVLFLDTLALLPAFIFPWGYGNAAVLALGLLCCFLWAARSTRATGVGGLLLVAVFAVTRLPSGNLWDALIDPWLWLLAHGLLARSVYRADLTVIQKDVRR